MWVFRNGRDRILSYPNLLKMNNSGIICMKAFQLALLCIIPDCKKLALHTRLKNNLRS